ncbi:rhodanese-like domain-containing protein [Candidatus Parvarchaeota archaeon]|nr:MAG: rhodanese-like domain-containing protein [Candidatus Parvarchaeota archaeon]
MKTITAKELKEKIDSGKKFKLVDVLLKNSFDSHHIPKSISIPGDELSSRASKELPDKKEEIIVYCASKTCQASPNAAKKLEEMGYTKIIDFEDGLAGWEGAGYKFEGED